MRAKTISGAADCRRHKVNEAFAQMKLRQLAAPKFINLSHFCLTSRLRYASAKRATARLSLGRDQGNTIVL